LKDKFTKSQIEATSHFLVSGMDANKMKSGNGIADSSTMKDISKLPLKF